MLKAGSSPLCGLFVLLTLYVLLTLSGCSVVMAMVGDKEPNFEHITVEAPKEESDFEFNQPGTPKDLGESKTNAGAGKARAKTHHPTLESDARC